MCGSAWLIHNKTNQYPPLHLYCFHHLYQTSSPYHYNDVIMTTMASQITSLTVVYSTVYSDADQRKHQSSASLAFVWGIHRDRWIPHTKGQLRGNVSIWWRHHMQTNPPGTRKWKVCWLLDLFEHRLYQGRILHIYTAAKRHSRCLM